MIDHWSWRLLFYVVIPIAVIDIILGVVMLPNVETPGPKPKLDVPGAITSIIGFSVLLYGFSEAGSKGWGDALVLTSITIGVIFVLLFVARELTTPSPMLNLRVFALTYLRSRPSLVQLSTWQCLAP